MRLGRHLSALAISADHAVAYMPWNGKRQREVQLSSLYTNGAAQNNKVSTFSPRPPQTTVP